jgi:asparagine synthase (glutamine-hydrolysing)
MAVRASKNIKTFTIRFPGFPQQDETFHARKIARYFKTEHIELDARSTSAELIPKLPRQFDEPMVDSSMIPTFLVSKLVRQHCTVALGGDGGDELFGGYSSYSHMLWTKKYPGSFPLPFRQALSFSVEKLFPTGMKGKNWLQGLKTNFEISLPTIAPIFGQNDRKRLIKNYSNTHSTELYFHERIPKNLDLVQRATRMDFKNYLAEDILVKLDRASMLNSLEVRAPILDYRIIEFAYAKVPSHLKATIKNKKIILKQLANKILPKDFDTHRKQGFSIPLTQWLKSGPFRDLFHDVLLDSNCIFDKKIIQSLLHGQDFGRDNSERLFALVLFELWSKEYKPTL